MKNFKTFMMKRKREDYLPPDYYIKLLKTYSFSGITDIEIFDNVLKKISTPFKAMEFGCGTGRGTIQFLKRYPQSDLDILDLSTEMLDYSRKNYAIHNAILSDSLNYMQSCNENYDFCFSLWSFSHSVHQHLERFKTEEQGKSHIHNILKKFIENNLNNNGKFFIIHFDSQSDEQKILMKQWAKKSYVYDRGNKLSLSLEAIKDSLEILKSQNLINYQIEHLLGDPIYYDSMEEALEIFLNFHLEGEFNNCSEDKWNSTIKEVEMDLQNFTLADKRLAVRPACYTILIEKK